MRGMRSAMMAAMVLGLAACGGTTEPGGPLRVVEVTPATLAVNVPVTDTVTIRFSKALLPASVNDSTIVLSHNGLKVLGTRVLSADARTVSLIPKLGNHQFYVLEVRTGVQDAAGSALAEPYIMAFSTVSAGRVAVVDPRGDTYNGSAIPDVISLTVTPGQDTVTISLGFAGLVSSSESGLPNAVIGLIDLDIDQDAQTGFVALADIYGPPGTQSGLGVEYYVYLFLDPQGNAFVVNSGTAAIAGLAPVTFGDSSLTLKIPLASLGYDDGNMNIAAVVGTVQAPTDVVPNVGHLTLGIQGQVGTGRTARALRARAPARAAPIGVWGR